MFGLNKEKFLVIGAAIFAGLIIWLVLVNKTIILPEWILSQKPRVYYATPPNDTKMDSLWQSMPARNPFISLTKKIEYVISLPLPDVANKAFTLMGFQPLPEVRNYPTGQTAISPTQNGLLRLPLGLNCNYDTGAKLPLPTATSLPSADAIQKLVDDVRKKTETPTPPGVPGTPSGTGVTPTNTAPLKEDTLILKNGIKLTGKFVIEKEGLIWFVPTGRNMVQSYNKQDVDELQRVYTVAELYQIELAKVITTDAYSWAHLSEWCLSNGLAKESAEALKSAVKLNNHELRFYAQLADYYISAGDFDSEMALYQDALKTEMLNKDVIYYRLGVAYDRLQLYDEAVKAYNQSIEINSNNAQSLLKLANYYYHNHNYDAGRKMYDRLKNITTSELTILEGIAYLEYLQGNFELAQKSLTEYSQRPEASAQTWNILGLMALLDADYAQAGACFVTAITNHPNSTTVWNNLGLLYLAANMLPQANTLFAEYIDLNPADEIPVCGLAYSSWLSNKPDDAFKYLDEALKMAPDSFIAHYVRAQIYFAQQKYAEAQPDFLWCLNNDSSFSETLSYLAMIALYQKDYPGAIRYYQAYQTCLASGSTQTPAQLVSPVDSANLTVAYLGDNNLDAARTALAVSDTYVPALNIQGYLAYKSKDVDQALEKFEAAAAIDPTNLYAQNSLLKIRKAANEIIWTDTFARPNGASVSKGWTENEKYGVEISIADNQCVFKGTQKLSDNGLTALERAVSRPTFISFEAHLQTDTTNNSVTGIYLANASKDNTFYLAKTKTGLVYGFSGQPDVPPAEWQSFTNPAPVADDFTITLEISPVKGKTQSEITCYLDNKKCDTIPTKGSSFINVKDASYLLGIFGYAPVNQNWELRVLSATTFEEKTK